MYWGRGVPLSQGSILDSTGKALEHRSIDKLDGEELEKYIAGAPLDLSGFAGKNVSREADSPLDLSTKTRKNHADSTENREMYPFHPGGYASIREMQTMLPPNHASNPTYVGGGTLAEAQGTLSMETIYRRRQVSPHISESVNTVNKMYKHNQQLGPPPTATSRQWPEQEKRMVPPRPDSVRNATAAGYMHSRNKLAASSDEQYYAMIKSIQQRQVNEHRYIKNSVSMNVMPGNLSSGHTSSSGMSVRQKQDHLGTVIAQKQLLARSTLPGTTDCTKRIYHTTHKPNYIEITQRCSPDSTISGAGHVLNTEHKSRMMPSQTIPYSNSPVVGLSQGKVYPAVQNAVAQLPRDYQKASYSRPMPYQRGRERNIKAETLTSEMLYMKQSRPILAQSASFPLQSTKILQETQMQRSLIRGTSGITPSQTKEMTESKKHMNIITSSEHLNFDRSRQFLAGHHGKETVIKSPISQMISNKQSKSDFRHNDNRNLICNTYVSTKFTGPEGSSALTQKNAQTSFSPITSSESFSMSSQTKSQTASTVPAPKDIYPLAISIPLSSESMKTNDITRDSKESRPRPFSKKHIIMSAINRDEGLKNILNSDTPKTNFSPSPNTKPSLLAQDSFPSCPESPKMPTLSPQQKLPLQNAGLSLQGNDPPTLDIASKQDPFVKIPAKKAYFQDKRPRLLSSLPRKNEPESDYEDADDDADNEKETISHESSIVFHKRPVVHYKKIPIANVAPMVHGNVSSEKDVREDPVNNVTSENSIVKTESYVEGAKSPIHDSSLASVDTVLPVKTTTLVERRNSSLFPPQKSIFTVEKTVKENIAKIESVDCNLENCSTSVSSEPTAEVPRNDDHVPSNPQENPVTEQLQREPQPKVEYQTSAAVENEGKKYNKQEKARELRDKARLRSQHRFQSKKVKGNRARVIKCKEKVQNKNKGFIDFKPEVLVTRTRNQTSGSRQTFVGDRRTQQRRRLERSHRNLRQKVRNLVKGTKMRSKVSIRYNKALSQRNHTAQNDSVDGVQTDAQIEGVPTAESAVESKEVLLPTETAEIDGCAVNNPDTKQLDDGTWEIGGTSSTLKQTLRNGKSKGGIMMKLLFKPKKRVRRRSSTQRIGKSKRRSKFRKKRAAFQKTKTYYKRSRLNTNGNLADNRAPSDDDVFLAEDHVGCDDLDPNVDMDYCDSVDQPALVQSIEVKKLVVCKDTGETILHRAARLGHLDVVVYCLTTGSVHVSAKDNAGYTPLHESCVSGHIDIVRLLLTNGANVNCASQDGIRPIHDAVENDHLEIVRLLIAFGADLTLATYGGVTPIKISHSDAMFKLLEGCLCDINGCDPDNVDVDYAWQFDVVYNGNAIPETSIFADIPDDPEHETEENFIFESERVLFPIIKLPNVAKEMLQKCVLLSDISEYEFFKNSKSSVRDICKRHSVETLKSDIVSHPELALYQSRFKVIPSDKCHLVYLRDCNQIYDNCEQKISATCSKTIDRKEKGDYQKSTGTDSQDQEIRQKELESLSLSKDRGEKSPKSTKRKYRKRMGTPCKPNTSKYSCITETSSSQSTWPDTATAKIGTKVKDTHMDILGDELNMKDQSTDTSRGISIHSPDQVKDNGEEENNIQKMKLQSSLSENLQERGTWRKFRDLKLKSDKSKVGFSLEGTERKDSCELSSHYEKTDDKVPPPTSKQCLLVQRSDMAYKRKLDFNPHSVGQPQVKLKRQVGLGINASQANSRRYENEFMDFLSRGKDSSVTGAKNNTK